MFNEADRKTGENCYLCVNIYTKTERLSNKAVENLFATFKGSS